MCSSVPSPRIACSSSSIARSRSASGVRAASSACPNAAAPAIPHAAEQVDGEAAVQAFRHRGGEMQEQVPSPRVSDHPGAVPGQGVQHGDGVRHRGRDVERAFDGQRLQAALLVGGDPVAVADLVREPVQVLIRESRPAVQNSAARRRRAPSRRARRLGRRRRSSAPRTP